MAEVASFIGDFAIRIEAVTRATAQEAARLRSEYRNLRLPDALVLAAAGEMGAAIVLTGDESWARMDPRVAVVRAA